MPKIVYDYDTEISFNKYKTFNFFEDVGKGLNKFDMERITKEIKSNLEKQGIYQIKNPDFYVNVSSKIKKQYYRNTVGISVGSRNGGFGYGISGGIPISKRKLNQQITIDFVESKNNRLLWQSISYTEIKEILTPEQRNEHYKVLVKKILTGFPPQKK